MMQTSHTHSNLANHQIEGTPSVTHLSIQRYIESKYSDCYKANIQCTYENLLYVINANGQYVAAVGYRQPEEIFFLEQYLASSAEYALTQLYGETVKRAQLVEIGNLVGDNSHAVFFLMQELWSHLSASNYEHIVLTCTNKLQRRFRNLSLTTLTHASKEHVDNPDSWGSYYDNSPRVMTGKLSSYDNRFSLHQKNRGLSIGYSNNSSILR